VKKKSADATATAVASIAAPTPPASATATTASSAQTSAPLSPIEERAGLRAAISPVGASTASVHASRLRRGVSATRSLTEVPLSGAGVAPRR